MKKLVRVDGKTYETEIEDLLARPIRVWVDGELFEIFPEEAETNVAPKALNAAQRVSTDSAPAAPNPARIDTTSRTVQDNALCAPMPGVILEISVKRGERVTAGQAVCVLEAMKMKNILRAPRDATVAEILVSPGQHVTHQQVLVQF